MTGPWPLAGVCGQRDREIKCSDVSHSGRSPRKFEKKGKFPFNIWDLLFPYPSIFFFFFIHMFDCLVDNSLEKEESNSRFSIKLKPNKLTNTRTKISFHFFAAAAGGVPIWGVTAHCCSVSPLAGQQQEWHDVLMCESNNFSKWHFGLGLS